MRNAFFQKLTSFFRGKTVFFLLLTLVGITIPTAAYAAGDLLEGVFTAGFGVILSPVTVLAWLSFKISSFLLGIAGITFNWTVAVLVFDFGKYFGNSPGLLLGWGVLRDFANIGLLFGFVFMGISTILDLHSYPWKKSLPMLVIFAILLNFSLFVTEAVIDSTNVVSTILFEQSFEPVGCRETSWLDCVINTGVAGAILTNANIATAYSGDGSNVLANIAQGTVAQFVDPVGNTLKFIALAILISVAATVFFAAAGLFLSRGITLAFLMVTSPIGFAGMAVPFLHGLAEKWWHELIHQSFFAPVFLLLLLVGLKITESLTAISGNGTIGTVFSSRSVVDTGALLVFFLVIGFFMAALMVAKQFGIKMADLIIEKTSGTVGAISFGTAGAIGRRTIGSASNATARAIRTGPLKNIPILGRTLAGVADIGATASYDLRGKSTTFGQVSAVAQKGRRGEIDEVKKGVEEYKASIDNADKEKYALAKYEKDRIKDKQARGASSPALDRKLAKAEQQIGQTTEGTVEKEKEKKEKFDKNVKEWNEAAGKLKEATEKIAAIDRQLAAEQGRRAEDQNPTLIARLQNDRAEYVARQTAATTDQNGLEESISELGRDLVSLRKTIKDEQSRYRRNVEGITLPNVLGLSLVDRTALRAAALSMKKSTETGFKPKNLNDALAKGLVAKLSARGLEIPNS